MKLAILPALFLYSGFVFSQGRAQDSARFRENYYKLERSISMRDGTKLFTAVIFRKTAPRNIRIFHDKDHPSAPVLPVIHEW